MRDVTATVASIPLIVASILSKKLAEGLEGLVMDVKLGSGAFMRDAARAEKLAREISRVSAEAGLPCTALITDMNLPLAGSAGNALEVREAIDFLTGEDRHDRLNEVIMALGTEMLLLGGLAADADQAGKMITEALDSGQAAQRFAGMVAGQGGSFRSAGTSRPLPAGRSGQKAGISRDSGRGDRDRHAQPGQGHRSTRGRASTCRRSH